MEAKLLVGPVCEFCGSCLGVLCSIMEAKLLVGPVWEVCAL